MPKVTKKKATKKVAKKVSKKTKVKAKPAKKTKTKAVKKTKTTQRKAAAKKTTTAKKSVRSNWELYGAETNRNTEENVSSKIKIGADRQSQALSTKQPNVKKATPAKKQREEQPVIEVQEHLEATSSEIFHNWQALRKEAKRLIDITDPEQFEHELTGIFVRCQHLTPQQVSDGLSVLRDVVFVPQTNFGAAPKKRRHLNIDHLVLLRAAFKAATDASTLVRGLIQAQLTDVRTPSEAEGRVQHFNQMH